MRLVRLLTAALLLSRAGWHSPGFVAQPGMWWKCRACRARIQSRTWRSANCLDDGWFMIGACVQGCAETAVRFAFDEWRCLKGHHFPGPSCPGCQYWGVEQRGRRIVCGGPEQHSFYFHPDPVCTNCHSGYVLFMRHDQEAACEACGRKQPRR